MLDIEIDHLGYAVNDIDKSIKLFNELGYEITSELVTDDKRSVKIIFMQRGNLKIELISPINENSPINNYLKKNGNIPYHICYIVPDINETIEKLRNLKFKLFEGPETAIAFINKKVAFLYHIDYGVLELVEK